MAPPDLASPGAFTESDTQMIAWIVIAAATVSAILIAMLIRTEWSARRGHPRKGLQWAKNAPAASRRIERPDL
jgi:hypothetical protein